MWFERENELKSNEWMVVTDSMMEQNNFVEYNGWKNNTSDDWVFVEIENPLNFDIILV